MFGISLSYWQWLWFPAVAVNSATALSTGTAPCCRSQRSAGGSWGSMFSRSSPQAPHNRSSPSQNWKNDKYDVPRCPRAAVSSLTERKWGRKYQGWLVVTQQAWDGDRTHSQLCLSLGRSFGLWTQDKASLEALLGEGNSMVLGPVHYHENKHRSTIKVQNIHSATLLTREHGCAGAELFPPANNCGWGCTLKKTFLYCLPVFSWRPLKHSEAFLMELVLE